MENSSKIGFSWVAVVVVVVVVAAVASFSLLMDTDEINVEAAAVAAVVFVLGNRSRFSLDLLGFFFVVDVVFAASAATDDDDGWIPPAVATAVGSWGDMANHVWLWVTTMTTSMVAMTNERL